MITQTLYKGRYADSKPTAAQIALLQKMGVRQPIIDALNREHAFLLIRQITIKYYEEQSRRRFNGKIVLKW